MAFNFNCPHCGGELRAEEEWEGRETTCPHCGKPVRILRPANGAGGEPEKERRKLKKLFQCWWFTLMLVIPVGVVGGVLTALQSSSTSIWADFLTGVFWAGAMSLIPTAMWCILLYRYWRLIPPERAVTTPGKAVGFLFIPVFNLYWMFVSLVGLGNAFDREGVCRRAGATATAYCVTLLCLCGVVVLFGGGGMLLRGNAPEMWMAISPVLNLLQLPAFALYIVVSGMFQGAALRLSARREYGIGIK